MGLEVHAAQTVHFCANFIKQKLNVTPENGATGQVRSGLRPYPGVWRSVQVQGGLLQPWSLGHLGQNLAGRWEPTQKGQQCPCLGWVAQLPGSEALKMWFWSTICPNYKGILGRCHRGLLALPDGEVTIITQTIEDTIFLSKVCRFMRVVRFTVLKVSIEQKQKSGC